MEAEFILHKITKCSILNLDLLPSMGAFYDINSELVLKSAKNKEIKHWSTMDEHDPLDVREKINFIINLI